MRGESLVPRSHNSRSFTSNTRADNGFSSNYCKRTCWCSHATANRTFYNAWEFLRHVNAHPRCDLAAIEQSLAKQTMSREELRKLLLDLEEQPQIQQPPIEQQLQIIPPSPTITQQSPIKMKPPPIAQQLQMIPPSPTTTQQSPIKMEPPSVAQQLQIIPPSPTITQQSPIKMEPPSVTQQLQIRPPSPSITQQSATTIRPVTTQKLHIMPQPQQQGKSPKVLQPGEGYDIEVNIHVMNRTGKDWAVPDELEVIVTTYFKT